MSYKLLFQKVYDLVKWVYPTVNKFPREQRLMLSQRIEVTTIRILEMVIDMSGKDTREYRKKIFNEAHKLQILFRVCKDLAYLDTNKYEFASSMLTEIYVLLDSEHKTQDTRFGEVGKLGGGYWRPVEMVLSPASTILSYATFKPLPTTLLFQEFGACIQEG